MDCEKKLREALVDVNTDYEVTRWIEQTFPELKESEDERVRGKIIATIHLYYGEPLEDEAKEMIAWLEKQGGEQNLTLPKWKYKKDNTPLLRDSLILNKYGCVAKSPSGALVSDVWVIDYAELAKLPKEEIEKQGEQKPAFEIKTPEESLGIDSDTYNKIVDECIYGEQKPADADLKDIVDKEANAIWKEINTGGSYSIIDSFNQFYGICMQVAEAVVDCKKPTEWIQELESKLSTATPEQLAEWKEKYFKVEPAWSEEDETVLDNLIYALANDRIGNDRDEYISWLKSLKDRVQPKQKQAWSGGDEAHLHSLITHLEQWIEKHPNTTGADIQEENVAWLKSLRPQSTWKPSEEMIEALGRTIPENVMEISEDEILLNKLYQGLKYGRVLSEK